MGLPVTSDNIKEIMARLDFMMENESSEDWRAIELTPVSDETELPFTEHEFSQAIKDGNKGFKQLMKLCNEKLNEARLNELYVKLEKGFAPEDPVSRGNIWDIIEKHVIFQYDSTNISNMCMNVSMLIKTSCGNDAIDELYNITGRKASLEVRLKIKDILKILPEIKTHPELLGLNDKSIPKFTLPCGSKILADEYGKPLKGPFYTKNSHTIPCAYVTDLSVIYLEGDSKNE